MKILKFSEVPLAYQLACGLSTIGAVVQRRSYISHGPLGKVFFNLPILLIGPTGIGKDQAINKMEDALLATGLCPVLSGSTFESIIYELWKYHSPPHVGAVFAKELASFLGKKDYQSGLVEDLTNLLSNSSMFRRANKKDQIVLYQPTITVAAGSTLKWLHENMPPGTMEGGFLPRFLLVYSDVARNPMALPAYKMTPGDHQDAEDATKYFYGWLKDMTSEIHSWSNGKAMPIEEEAQFLYEPWYINRFKQFPPSVHGYANRMRDHTLKLAAIYAISNNRFFITAEDMQFAIDFVTNMIPTIEMVLLQPKPEHRAMMEIEGILPARRSVIYDRLINKYALRDIETAFNMLIKAARIELKPNEKWYKKEAS